MKNYDNQIDKLFDEENSDFIYLKNEKGEEVAFEQVALIPLEDDVLYAILKPVAKIDGLGEDEGLVFAIRINDDAKEYLELVTDEETVDRVFDLYNAIIASENDNY